MPFVIGRDRERREDGPTGHLGSYRALDGSSGAPLHLDLDGPHAVLVVGKRGYGKSYTVGVVAEELSRTEGVAPVVVDPMGAFRTLAGSGDTQAGTGDETGTRAGAGDEAGVGTGSGVDGSDAARVPADVVESPTVAADALDPRSWCELLDLPPESGAGALVWQAAGEASTLAAMRERVSGADASAVDRRAAANHLDLAASWGVFDRNGLRASDLAGGSVTVLDVSGLDPGPMNAIVHGVAGTLYRARVENRIRRLPWLLVDEAHAFFGGIAGETLETLLTRGRAPGVSLVLATQRPGAVPAVAVSQSDVLVSHRLTSEADIEALRRAQPTYMDATLAERLPDEPGEALIVDDATETIHTARIRRRDTPHDGASPRASEWERESRGRPEKDDASEWEDDRGE